MNVGLLDIVGGMLGGQAGGSAGAPMGGAQGGGQAELLNLIVGMLAGTGQGGQGGAGGGLGALLQQFQAAGLGEQVNSWVGTGQNLPVSPEQLQGALGGEQMSMMAERMGLSTGDLGAQLSQMLPQVVDQLTPGGQLPEGGLGNLGDLLGSLIRR
jgi:uncharacterized protein YidB (DUF937 family)